MLDSQKAIVRASEPEYTKVKVSVMVNSAK